MSDGSRRAIVIGAGIGGLAAAIALRSSGWDVRVYEQADAAEPVGAGISLWSNALAALRWLGVARELRERGAVRTGGGVRDPTGRWLSRSLAEAVEDSAAVSMLMVHRADLHEALLSALPRGTVGFGLRLTDIESRGQRVSVRLASATDPASSYPTFDEAALLVAADGLRSTVRSRWWPADWAPAYAGFSAWRGVTGQPFALAEQSQTLGPAAEVGLVQLQDGRVYWFATGDDPEGTRYVDERAEVLRRFGSWHPPIRAVVEATPAGRVLHHDLYRLPRPYPSFVQDRVVLLGDAAHAMLPTLGQGGCLALEDAVVLGDVLAGDAPVPAALRAYDSARRCRTERLSAQSDQLARITQLRHPIARAARDLALRLTPPQVAVSSIARATAWRPPDPRFGGRSTHS